MTSRGIPHARTRAGGLLAGFVVFAMVAGAANSMVLMWVAAGSVLALLMAWATPLSRFMLLPWAVVSAVAAGVLALRWHRHRDGRRDWVVWCAERGLLRREGTCRSALRWAQWWGRPCHLVRIDRAPEMDGREPLYSDADRPCRVRASRPKG